ncbi:nucleoside hydrolase [Mucilaginibacter gilvus]|uniref:Nucleoside hydrolase n=1 Tax=Mucilaginibacter gilvus TaxID=2305909 RepID=A0A3S3V6P6_9SPHI|nr:nucleoside hydrolase [Mucilaginibacter gilvus]RWY56982.1 nucleoside hydrolase [Mucilaginibacter gilvus]
MYKFITAFALVFCCSIVASGQPAAKKPVSIIFDSDMGPDYDDVGAIAMLHAFADKGEAKILATMASTNYPGVAGVLNVFNTYFKRPGIPIGVPNGKALGLRDWQHWTDTVLLKYPHQIKTNAEAEDAVKLYRKILATQPNHSVTIVTIGFLTNMSDLLKSPPDEYSKLDGRALVATKVKVLVSMGGKFPEGSEFNVNQDALASKYALDNWPVPVIFSGGEIGEKVKTGLPLIHNAAIKNSPVKDVFSICIPMAAEDAPGRNSWDETAVLVAVKGYSPYYTLHKGRINIAANGSNTWDNSGKVHAYLVAKMPPKEVADVINKLMMHQPRR